MQQALTAFEAEENKLRLAHASAAEMLPLREIRSGRCELVVELPAAKKQ